MFTGIIKAKGVITGMAARGGDVRLSVTSDGLPWSDYEAGESIAVNGVCLTAVSFRSSGSDRDGFDTDVSLETLDVTALGGLKEGAEVNLEPAISLGDRLGGHLVSGHVDCVAEIVSLSADARSIRLGLQVPQGYTRYIAKKGSVCIDGVSLTINEVSDDGFEVNIIPHTAEVTIIDSYAIGRRVNIEVDLLARYLERLMQQQDDKDISLDFLKAHGYAR